MDTAEEHYIKSCSSQSKCTKLQLNKFNSALNKPRSRDKKNSYTRKSYRKKRNPICIQDDSEDNPGDNSIAAPS